MNSEGDRNLPSLIDQTGWGDLYQDYLSHSLTTRLIPTNAGARLTEALVRYSNVLSIAGQKRRDYRNAKIVEESFKCHKN